MFKTHSNKELINQLNDALKPLALKTRAVDLISADFDSGKLTIEGSKSATISCNFVVDSFQAIHLSNLQVKSELHKDKNFKDSHWTLCVLPKYDDLVDFLDEKYSAMSPLDRIAEIQFLMKSIPSQRSRV